MKTSGFQVNKKSIFFVFSFLVLFSPKFLTAQSGSVSMKVSSAPIWDRDLGDTVLGMPYLQTESAVVACAGGSVQSFYMTGTPLWNFDPKDQLTPFIARSVEGAAYICDKSGYFWAVNRVGRELWREKLDKPIDFPPVVGWDGRVFIPIGSQVLCRTASGLPLWSIDLNSQIAGSPALDHAGSLITVLQNMDFVRVNQFSTVERVRLSRMPMLIVSLKSEITDSYVLLYPTGETEKITYNEGAAKGSKLSRGSFPRLASSPVSAVSRGDQFAVTFSDGRVQLISDTGQVTWTGDSHETAAEKGSGNADPGKITMVFDERGIYCISTRGETCFAPDGRRRFILKTDEASSVPAFSDEGLLYVCGKDKILHVYKVDSKPRTVQRSKYYGPQPEGNYGMGDPPPSPWAMDGNRFDPVQQNIMYNRISAAISSGQLGEAEPAYVGYLFEMIGFFLNDPHYSRVRPNVDPVMQAKFIRLLGKVGSRDTIPFLWKIFDRHQESSIKSACAEAIGDIGVDPEGSSYESYNFLLAANNPNRDPQLLLSATASIAALCRFSGPPLSSVGISLLRYFTFLTWAPNNIKNIIQSQLDDLYREGLNRSIQ